MKTVMKNAPSKKRRYLWYSLTSLFVGGGILLTIFILIRLFYAHPEVKICDFDLESLRPCSSFSKIVYLSSIVERKIVFSYYWDNVKAELLEKNPNLKSADMKLELAYVGYCIQINGNGIVDDLSPLNKIPLMGIITIGETVQFSPPQITDSNYSNLVIGYTQSGNFQIFNEPLFRKESKFWEKLNIDPKK